MRPASWCSTAAGSWRAAVSTSWWPRAACSPNWPRRSSSCRRRCRVGTLRFAHPTAPLIPATRAWTKLHSSLVQRGRELQTVCDLGARDAAPEENRGTDLRPHLRKSGLAFRGRCNGPPQGLVCPPAWAGKPRSISAGSSYAARGRGGKREEAAGSPLTQGERGYVDGRLRG